jgi:dephospho-CoA kinase
MGSAGRMKRPFVIGLTGNIATGKSEVARLLAGLGARVIDADRVAHEVMAPGGPAYDEVVARFGPEILAEDGTIDRRRLGAIVFRDDAALRHLEEAVHPAVGDEVAQRIARAEEAVVVVEAIKLIESGMDEACDELWVVTAPRALRIERLVANRDLSEEEATLRVDAQPPQSDKVAVASRVLANDAGLDQLQKVVEAAWAGIRSGAVNGSLTIRRAKQADVADIAALVRATGHDQADDVLVRDWLFSKGMWVAVDDGAVLGVAAWQAENLVCVTDVFHVAAGELARAGRRLLETLEAEARTLLCELNVLVLPPSTPGVVLAFLERQGYEQRTFDELHRIWREVLDEFVAAGVKLWVKQLRERMVMVPH